MRLKKAANGMKKLWTMMLSLCVVAAAMACSNDDGIDGTTGASQPAEGEDGVAEEGPMLVIYFSRAGENWQVGFVERGNTAVMVDYICDLADVDVFEIEPATPYPDGYEDCKTAATAEFNSDARPAILSESEDFSDYSIILVGGPVWWARPPMIFRTFFEAHPELEGKVFIPFGTHGGSGVGSYTSLIREYYPSATILESLGIAGSDIRNTAARQTVEAWLKRLGIELKATTINSIHTERSPSSGLEYMPNGIRAMPHSAGMRIQKNKKYLIQ